VCSVEQSATFLSYVARDRLAVMWWLMALRGLRRGEAAGLRWADVDLKTVQAQLGHSSIVLTADTYTSVLTDLLAYGAEATARLALAAAARNPGPRHRPNGPPAKSAGPCEAESSERPVTRRSKRRTGSKRGRPPASDQRPTKIKAV
jgi:hypothetical protein